MIYQGRLYVVHPRRAYPSRHMVQNPRHMPDDFLPNVDHEPFPVTVTAECPPDKVVPGSPFTGAGDPRNGRGPEPGTGGRTPNAVRAACRKAFEERIPLLMSIADGEALPFQKRYKAKAGKRLPDGSVCTVEEEAEGKIITAKWEESPDIDQRLAAIKELGKFGGMQAQTILDGEGNGTKPVYEITFE